MPTINIKMRVFVPKEVLNDAKVIRNIQHVMSSKTAQDLKREFAKTYRSWDRQPNFVQDHYFGSRVLWIKVFTYSTQYRLVNAGARPHEIRPRRGGLLRFQTGFRPKSRPRVIGSSGGGKFGDFISARVVHHPGHEAREFDAQIAEEYQETFAEDVQDAIKDALP